MRTTDLKKFLFAEENDAQLNTELHKAASRGTLFLPVVMKYLARISILFCVKCFILIIENIYLKKYRKCFSILWIEFFDHFCFAYRSNNSDPNPNKSGSVTQELYVPVSHEFDVASRSPNILTFSIQRNIL